MLTKKEIKLLTEVLNLEGVKVSHKHQYEGIGIILKIESTAKESACNICGTKSDRVHQNHQQIIKDLDWGEQAVFLEINRRQFKCEKCKKPFSEEVSIDLWTGYKSLATEIIPNAQVVADRFHVMAQINQELDGERKKEKRKIKAEIKQSKTSEEKLEKEIILAGITDSKYAILKNKENLNDKQRDKLAQVQDVSERLKIMYQLKEEFREIFEKKEKWTDSLLGLGTWLSKAQKYFVNSKSTIYRWFDEILAYFDNRTTSGVVEGINNKLKLIKRSGYGFTNFENFRNRCLLNWHFNC